MCTIGYIKDLNLIFKNRDKIKETPEEVIAEDSYTAVKTKGADYFSCGVNKYSFGFVSAAINTPQWIALIYAGKLQEARQLLERENNSLSNPMLIVSEMLPETKSINQVIDKIRSAGLKWIGYNILLADAKEAVVIETCGPEVSERKLSPKEVVTNHFLTLKYGPKEYSEYPSSFRRYDYGNVNIKQISSLSGLFDMLKPIEEEKREIIWRRGEFKTISSNIIDFKNGLLYRCQELNGNYLISKKPNAQNAIIKSEDEYDRAL